MIAGRMVTGQVVRRIAARSVVLASLLLGLLGFLLYWSSPNAIVVLVGLAVTGFGVAGLYPLLISLAIGAAGGLEDQAGSRTALASGTAILLLPLVLGRLADFAGLKAAFTVVAVLLAGMVFLMMVGERAAAGIRVPRQEAGSRIE
jgi:fucose permease